MDNILEELKKLVFQPTFLIVYRAAFRIFIQGGRNGFPRNVGGADGYRVPLAHGS